MKQLPFPDFSGRLLSAVPVIPKRAARIARNVLCVGFDTEWRANDGYLLSVQFAVSGVDGVLRSAVFYPGTPKINAQTLVALVQQFLDVEGLLPPLQKRQRRVALIAHFAGAELSMLTDALDLNIRQIGKAHHARFPDVTDPSGTTWRVQLVDLYAFYKASLADIGKLISMNKIDEDRTHLDASADQRPSTVRAICNTGR